MDDKERIIRLGPFFFVIKAFPKRSSYVALDQAEKIGARIINCGDLDTYFAIEFPHERGAELEAAEEVRKVWSAIFPDEDIPEIIEGNLQLMLLGEKAELRLASDGSVWFGDLAIGQVPKPSDGPRGQMRSWP